METHPALASKFIRFSNISVYWFQIRQNTSKINKVFHPNAVKYHQNVQHLTLFCAIPLRVPNIPIASETGNLSYLMETYLFVAAVLLQYEFEIKIHLNGIILENQ